MFKPYTTFLYNILYNIECCTTFQGSACRSAPVLLGAEPATAVYYLIYYILYNMLYYIKCCTTLQSSAGRSAPVLLGAEPATAVYHRVRNRDRHGAAPCRGGAETLRQDIPHKGNGLNIFIDFSTSIHLY